jgi:O-antigen ligase
MLRAYMFTKQITVSRNWLLILFIGLASALFLGDGKQMYVDLFGVLLTVVIAYFALRKTEMRTLPPSITIGWVLVLGYSLIRCFNSASTADSIYSFVRLAEAYIYFYIFFCFADISKIRTFLKASVWLTFVGVITAVFFVINPNLAAQLPGMNLLYPTYGHNHLATLLLFVIPFLTISAIKHQSRAKFMLFFSVFFLLFTFARLAYFIVAIFFLAVLLLLRRNQIPSTQKFIGVLTVTISTILIALLLLAKVNGPNVLISGNFITKQIFKSPQLQTNRGEYWTQAIKSIKTSPFIGHGLGTFSLESKKYQSEPGRYSFFAHNSILEITSELGLIGLGLMFYLFATIIIEIIRRYQVSHTLPSYWYGLVSGVFLIAVYSLVEFNLSYLVVWIIFWSSCGLLIISDKTRSTARLPKSLLIGNLGVIMLFYIVTTISILISITNITNKEKLAFMIAPYERANATTRIKKTEIPFSKRELGLIQIFYKEDADILYQVSKTYETENELGKAITYLEQALRFDPKNVMFHRSLLTLYLKTSDNSKMISEILFMTQQLVPQINIGLTSEQFSFPVAIDAIKESQQYLLQPISSNDYFSKFYYFVGLKLIDQNPELTRQLWVLARDIKPSWSYYHIEIASLEKYIFKNEAEAFRLLEYCKQDPTARSHCTLVEKDLYTDNFLKVASLQDEIQKIPQYSN